MSQEKLEAVRQCIDALNRRDVDGYLACCVDNVQLVPATAAIEGTYTGSSGIRRFLSDIADIAPDFRLDIERLEPIGRERVLSFERGSASGRTSGASLKEGIAFATVYHFADHKIERIQVFTDRQQALEADAASGGSHAARVGLTADRLHPPGYGIVPVAPGLQLLRCTSLPSAARAPELGHPVVKGGGGLVGFGRSQAAVPHPFVQRGHRKVLTRRLSLSFPGEAGTLVIWPVISRLS